MRAWSARRPKTRETLLEGLAHSKHACKHLRTHSKRRSSGGYGGDDCRGHAVSGAALQLRSRRGLAGLCAGAQVAEFDAPAVLLKKPGGAFKGLAAAAALAPKVSKG